MVQLTLLCFCLPTLLLAAPVEDALKQQMASGLFRGNDDASYWNYVNSGMKPFRRLDSLSGDTFGKVLQKKFDSLSGITFGTPYSKKNFDEIDNTGLDFVGNFRKRNFDEIDNAGFGAFIKRAV